MPLPNETELTDALLKAMHRIGRPASIEEQEHEVVRALNISDADASEIHEGSRSRLNYRLAWTRTYLKGLGVLRWTDRGVWELTERGRGYKSFLDLRGADEEEFDDLFDNAKGLEGLDTQVSGIFGDYPIDSVLIRQETRTLFDVVRRIREGRFIMDPDFQRDFVWPLEKQSKLVESMLMRIPIPVFYLGERDDGTTVVVDGLQRLTTFSRFLNGEFALRGLELAIELNGMRFSDLAPKLQNRLEDTQLILFLIDSKVPDQAKLDIFERVNGGVPLSRQQMRNSIYCGPATLWLKNEVQSDEFLLATQRGLDWRTMRDRECINRFCAFALFGAMGYEGDMDSFLGRALKEMNRKSESQLENLSQGFRRSMRNNFTVFGIHAFRKHTRNMSRRSVINVAIFDVFSSLLSRIPEEQVHSAKQNIQGAFYELMENWEFIDAISVGTNSSRKVKARFSIAEQAFQKIFSNVGELRN